MAFSLAELGKRKKGTVQRVPVIESAKGPETKLRTILRRMLKASAKEVREGVIPAFQREQKMFTDEPRDWFSNLRSLQASLVRAATSQMEELVLLEAARHTDAWARSVKAALSIDIAGVIRREDLGRELQVIVARNTGLIRSLSDDTVKSVEQAVLRNASSGRGVTELRRELREKFGLLDNRAKLIARDQNAKTIADFNRARHQQAGITEYTWRTSRDERVRSLHASLEGNVYKYGERTGAEEGLPPGGPINCRCTAEAIVRF